MQLPLYLGGWLVRYSRVMLFSLQSAVDGCFFSFHSVASFSLCWSVATAGDRHLFHPLRSEPLERKDKRGEAGVGEWG